MRIKNTTPTNTEQESPRVPTRLRQALVLLSITACTGSEMPSTETFAQNNAAISAATWENLASKKIFFGHQSVGANIIDGVKALAAEGSPVELRVVRSRDPASVQGPAFVEASVGENGDPRSKAEAFVAAVNAGFGHEGGIALFKYCYVDLDRNTNVEQLLEQHRQLVGQLENQYPHLQVVHVTIPLTTVESLPAQWLKTALGRSTRTELNVKRNQFNSLMRREYAGTGRLFDLAELESTRPDGTRSYIERDGEKVYSLASEWTSDGGHLNPAGARLVAQRLLAFLSELPVNMASAEVGQGTAGVGR